MRFTKGHLRLSRKEIWNAREHIASCIYDGLLQFKNTERLGYPADISPNTWEEYLDKMLYSFKEISTDYANDPCKNYFGAKLTLKSDLERNQIKEERERYLEKIQEGLNLFSEYCMDLWD